MIIRVWWSRVRAFVNRRDDLRDEIDAHLALLAADFERRGLTPDEARAAARREFGGVERTKDAWRDQRGLPFLDTLAQDIRYGLRTMRRGPVFSAVVILSLALAIGANTAIFALIDAVVLKALPVDRPSELVTLRPAGRSGDGAFSYAGFAALRDHSDAFSDVFTFTSEGGKWNVVVGGASELAAGQLVTGNFFSALRVPAIAGRALVAADDDPSAPPVAVLSYGYWKRRFDARPSAVGSTIVVNDVGAVIVGVMPPPFFGVSVGWVPDVWMPLAIEPRLARGDSLYANPSTWWLPAMARLRPGVAPQRAQANVDVVLPVVQQAMGIEPAAPVHFDRIVVEPGERGVSVVRGEVARPLAILMGLVGFVLLLACANVASLLLARAGARQREIAVRLSLGSSRSRLVRQVLTEGLCLSVIGGALGLVFALWSGNLLVALMSQGRIPVDLSLHADGRLVAFTVGVSLLTGLLFAMAPAIHASRLDPGPALNDRPARLGGTRLRLMSALVALQVALSLLLLVGAGLFVRTLQNLRTRDLGFVPDHVLVMTIEPTLAGYKGARLTSLYQQVLERVNAVPGVVAASVSRFGLMGAGYSARRVFIPGYAPASPRDASVAINVVGPRFFETNGMALVSGREFGSGDTGAAPKVAVVNERFALAYFPGQNAIGKRFGFAAGAPEELEIVGVVHDAKYFYIRRDSPRFVATPYLQGRGSPGLERMVLQVRTAIDPLSLASAIRREIQAVASDVPILGVRTAAQQIDTVLVQERLLSTLSSFFGLLALLLSSIGLYGVTSHAVVQRTREIGVRLALGATASGVIRLMLRDALRLVLAGLMVGVPAAFAAARLVAGILYGLTATDPFTLALAIAVLGATALVAAYVPSRRAATVDPLVALRCE